MDFIVEFEIYPVNMKFPFSFFFFSFLPGREWGGGGWGCGIKTKYLNICYQVRIGISQDSLFSTALVSTHP